MKKGFTLIELLVVIGIIAILAGIVIIAVNPGRQLGQARDSERWNDVNALLNAIHQFALDNNGIYPAALDAVADEVQIIGTGGVGADCLGATPTCTGSTNPVKIVVGAGCYADLTADLVTGDYLTALPIDPQIGTASDTRYFVNVDAGTTGRVTIGSCDPEQTTGIEVKR